jgi:hypothetical protein
MADSTLWLLGGLICEQINNLDFTQKKSYKLTMDEKVLHSKK